MGLINLAQEIKDVKRLEEILHVLVANEFGYLIEKLKLKHILPMGIRVRKTLFTQLDTQPKRIRKIFEQLGGTFVKLGQLLSIRPDLIPQEYCDEFAKLQDQVPAFSGEKAKKIIEKELNKKITKVFSYFNEKPIAAASIGQVHEAVLKNGRKVVVKVQRPEIKEKIKTDIHILYKIADLLEKKIKPRLFNPHDIIQEFERYTEKELDYIREGKNIDIFYKNFLNEKKVKIPEIFQEYTTNKLLVLEYIDGIKLLELKKIKKKSAKAIATNIAQAVFKQIFIDGFFHADPHPGNILVLKTDKIALLDFGIVGRFSEPLKEKVSNLFIGMVNADLEEITNSLLDLGIIGDNLEIDKLKDDIREKFGEYYNTNIDKVDFIDVFNKSIFISREYDIKFPINFVLLGKSILTLQGVCLKLNPEFNLVEEARPFINKLIKQRMKAGNIVKQIFTHSIRLKNFILRLPEETTQLVYRIRDADKNLSSIDKDIRKLTRELDYFSNRMVFGMLIAATLLAGALTINISTITSYICFTLAIILFILLIVSILREKRGD